MVSGESPAFLMFSRNFNLPADVFSKLQTRYLGQDDQILITWNVTIKYLVTHRHAMDYDPANRPELNKIGNLVRNKMHRGNKKTLKWSESLYPLIFMCLSTECVAVNATIMSFI